MDVNSDGTVDKQEFIARFPLVCEEVHSLMLAVFLVRSVVLNQMKICCSAHSESDECYIILFVGLQHSRLSFGAAPCDLQHRKHWRHRHVSVEIGKGVCR